MNIIYIDKNENNNKIANPDIIPYFNSLVFLITSCNNYYIKQQNKKNYKLENFLKDKTKCNINIRLNEIYIIFINNIFNLKYNHNFTDLQKK